MKRGNLGDTCVVRPWMQERLGFPESVVKVYAAIFDATKGGHEVAVVSTSALAELTGFSRNCIRGAINTLLEEYLIWQIRHESGLYCFRVNREILKRNHIDF